MTQSASVFIALDGIDGVGKSTQIERLMQHLGDRGLHLLLVRDPGTTVIGAKLRELLLDSDLDLHRRTEAMLFMASRCEMIETSIRPALESGTTVVSDRFLLANVVYQSVGGGVPTEQLWKMGLLANQGLLPDMTVLLDMPAEAALRRLGDETDRMERRGLEYMESVRQAFLKELPHSSPVTAVIDAGRSPDEVTAAMLHQVDRFLESRGLESRGLESR
ncbi:MAG: dTMP kinase [Rubripirellula sp.]